MAEVEQLRSALFDAQCHACVECEEKVKELRAEVASLADNRDGLEHDWSERGKRIEAALAVIQEIKEGLGADSVRDMMDEIREALTGGSSK